MFPNLYYAFKELFGLSLPVLKIVNSFGFFVAISFLLCAWLLVKELKRKQALGQFNYTEAMMTFGKPVTPGDLAINFIIGFIFGYKIGGFAAVADKMDNPFSYIASFNGSVIGGLIGGLIVGGLKWFDSRKQKSIKQETKLVKIWPSDRVGDMVVIAFIAGFAGAKIFDNLENWDRFIQDPIANLFAPSGLTFYGGLIVATLVMTWYLRKYKISFINMGDAIAPGLMLAYAVGRIGCQVSGDGDWGIVNSAYISDANGKVIAATPETFSQTLQAQAANLAHHGTDIAHLHHKTVKAFAGLPDWLFAQSYVHNVNKEIIPMANCTWDNYCNYLPLPVFPTPLYEVIMGLALFALLWSLRKKFKYAGQLFSVYLVVNGIERFLIEKIRVNTQYPILGGITQAEIISSLLVITGVILWVVSTKKKNKGTVLTS
jgi:phosphatidylglycerol---prolipoprotein diacylglyceryl transferase